MLMTKLFLTGIAALSLATGTAHAGYYGEDKWIANCRMGAIEKRHPETEPDDQLASIMVITPEDLPVLENQIKEFKKCIAFDKCTQDRAMGKVKHCNRNDKRWRSLFQ
jgi:hypothetical protein